jgi:hypothetical protein
MSAGSFLGNYLSNRNANKKKATTSGTTSSSTTPTMAPEYQGIQQALIPMIQNKLANPYKLPAGFEQAGIRNINKTYDLAGQSLGNNMTARGLGRSAIAGAGENALAGGRASDIVQYQGTLPMIQRQFQSEDIGQAMGLMGMGRGVSSTGTTSGMTEETGGGGSALGSGISGLVQMLGYLRGTGAFGGGGGGGMNNALTIPNHMNVPGVGVGTFPGWTPR